jgi:hypothetical protein
MGMPERLNDLGFVIGAFFTIIAVVLFANIIIMMLNDRVSLFTAIGFLIFGLVMMFARKTKP